MVARVHVRGEWEPCLAMQELLLRTPHPHNPLRDQEIFELTLLDIPNQLGTRYCVRLAHAEWVEVDGQVMWDRLESEYFSIQAQAQQRYAERRLALAEKGFI